LIDRTQIVDKSLFCMLFFYFGTNQQITNEFAFGKTFTITPRTKEKKKTTVCPSLFRVEADLW